MEIAEEKEEVKLNARKRAIFGSFVEGADGSGTGGEGEGEEGEGEGSDGYASSSSFSLAGEENYLAGAAEPARDKTESGT